MPKSNNIARLREKAGLTQQELAEIVGVSVNTIANWEKNLASKWIKNLNKLCKTLNCSLDELDNTAYPQPKIELSISDEVKETVRLYCLALKNDDNKKSTKIAYFATVHDPNLRFWLDEAQNAIKLWQEEYTKEIDVDFVVNSLVSKSLSLQLNETPPNEVKLPVFKEIVLNTNFSRDFLDKYASFNKKCYSRKLVYKTRYLSLYVIGWEPGQKAPEHHHGSFLDAFTILEGKVEHCLQSPGDSKKNKVPHESCITSESKAKILCTHKSPCVLNVGDWTFIDRDESHHIRNFTDERAVSFHIRFGAPPDDDNWEESIDSKATKFVSELVEKYQAMSYHS